MWEMDLATGVLFGPKAVDGLGGRLPALGIRRVVLCAGGQARRPGGLVERLAKDLSLQVEVALSPPLIGEPISDRVDALAKLLASECPDAIVAAGGGSVMDAAKLAACVWRNGGAATDYEAGRPITAPLPKIVAVPTTAGSGSEVTPYAVCDNAVTGRKFTVAHRSLRPTLAVVDPELAFDLPPEVTRDTALDAFVHLLEAHLSAQPSALMRPMIEDGIRTIGRSLARALRFPHDLEARTDLARAALFGGAVIGQVRTGMVHTISVAISQRKKLAHGFLNALICSHVLRFNVGAYEGRLGEAVGWLLGQELRSDAQALEALHGWLLAFGIPEDLGGDGALRDNLDALVARVRQDQGLPRVNRRAFTEVELAAIIRSVVGAAT